MTKKLYRKKGEHTRYYYLELSPTLFGEYLVVRKYGNISYKAPTGVRKNFFNSHEDAKIFFEKVLAKKQRKGYSLITKHFH